MYNISNITNATNYYELFVAVNTLSEGLYVTMLLAMLYIILLIAFSNQGIKTAFIGVGFIMSVIGIMALTLGFVGWGVVVVIILTFFIGLIVYMFST